MIRLAGAGGPASPGWKAAPTVLLGLGAVLLLGVERQQAMPLRAPLAGIPRELAGLRGQDRTMNPAEQRIVGMDAYIFRDYGGFTLYAGYYEHQTRGRTIHSPRNCLPGSGWEQVEMADRMVPVGAGRQVTVKRTVLAKGPSRALVYYWYQGRGRVASNEYRVKWDLLRDAALRGRTEEALVRVVVPITGVRDEAAADALAAQVAAAVVPRLDRALPAP